MRTDQELLEEISEKNEQAFDELYSRYSKPIYGFVFNYTGNKEDAQEITQAIFVKLWRKAGKFKGRSTAKTWIFRIATNTIMDYFRIKKRVKKVELPDQLESTDSQTVELVALEEAILKLSDRERMAILLVYGQAQSYKSTAKIMGCSSRAVEGLIRRAKSKLRELLK